MSENKKQNFSAKKDWHNLSLGDVADRLKVKKTGLSQGDIEKRLKRNGSNKLPEKAKTGAFVLFLRQFKSSLTYILLIAAALSWYFGEHIDSYVILAAVVVNVIVGFIQEYKAQNALASLKKIITEKVWVIRDGKEREVETINLVPGDIVILDAGNKIPADGRIFEAEHLSVNEAALTGESAPREKNNHAISGEAVLAERTNMVFTGTVVAEGRGKYYVTRTGVKTELGKIASLVRDTKEIETPLQNKLNRFSRKLGIGVLFLSAIVFLFGIWQGQALGEMFSTAIAIAVAAIPEGLVVGVTVILAIGMQRILKHGSLVRKLVAAETLGSTSVICADKTGTLTFGEMRVAKIVIAADILNSNNSKQEYDIEQKTISRIAFYCNNAVLASAETQKKTSKDSLLNEVVVGSPTEKALLISAMDSFEKEKEALRDRERLDEVPFSSKIKYMATMHKKDKSHNIVYLKGAPEKILQMVSYYQSGKETIKIDDKKREILIKEYESLSKKGLRLLAGAYKLIDGNKTNFKDYQNYKSEAVLVGFWGIKDPLRPEAVDAVKLTRKAGVRTIMITGDNRYTATAIANEVGIKPKPEEVIDGRDLAGLSSRELSFKLKKVKVFSRTTPEDKMRIISTLQASGEVVAMTGDGVNDAPALQKADIGLALGSGTDVARDTADIVLLDNNFSTIVAAVKQGRIIFDNIRKVILYLLANSFTEMAVVVIGLFLGWPLPILAAQILWINLVTDGLPDLALTQEPEEPEIMNENPVPRDVSILDFERRFLILFISLITTIFTLAVFYLTWKSTNDIDRARTVAFTAIGLESLLYVFSIRSVRHSILKTNFLSNKWLLAAVGGGFVIQILGVYLPFFQKVLRTVSLGLMDWVLITLACLLTILSIEITKYLFISLRQKKS